MAERVIPAKVWYCIALAVLYRRYFLLHISLHISNISKPFLFRSAKKRLNGDAGLSSSPESVTTEDHKITCAYCDEKYTETSTSISLTHTDPLELWDIISTGDAD